MISLICGYLKKLLNLQKTESKWQLLGDGVDKSDGV